MKKITANYYQSPAGIRLFEASLLAERLAIRVADDYKIDNTGLIELSTAINAIADSATNRLSQLISIYDKKSLLSTKLHNGEE